jgi:hypothetical protein
VNHWTGIKGQDVYAYDNIEGRFVRLRPALVDIETFNGKTRITVSETNKQAAVTLDLDGIKEIRDRLTTVIEREETWQASSPFWASASSEA